MNKKKILRKIKISKKKLTNNKRKSEREHFRKHLKKSKHREIIK